jgi:hypothetical protein
MMVVLSQTKDLLQRRDCELAELKQQIACSKGDTIDIASVVKAELKSTFTQTSTRQSFDAPPSVEICLSASLPEPEAETQAAAANLEEKAKVEIVRLCTEMDETCAMGLALDEDTLDNQFPEDMEGDRTFGDMNGSTRLDAVGNDYPAAVIHSKKLEEAEAHARERACELEAYLKQQTLRMELVERETHDLKVLLEQQRQASTTELAVAFSRIAELEAELEEEVFSSRAVTNLNSSRSWSETTAAETPTHTWRCCLPENRRWVRTKQPWIGEHESQCSVDKGVLVYVRMDSCTDQGWLYVESSEDKQLTPGWLPDFCIEQTSS